MLICTRTLRAGRHLGTILLAVGASAGLLLTGALPGAPGLTAPAAAQTAASAPTITLVRQDAWVAAGGTFTLQVATGGVASPDGYVVALTVHDRLQSRTAFDQSVDPDGSLGPTQNVVRVPLTALPIDPASGGRQLSVGLQSAADQNAFKLAARAGTGVYPLEVQLRDADDRTLAGFVTHVVVATVDAAGAVTEGRPLDVAWVWPLFAEPATMPDGSTDPAVVAELRHDGRLGRQVAALGTQPAVPVTLVPGPETTEAWETLGREQPDLQAGLSTLVSAGATSEVLAGPYVPLDLPSLLSGGLGGVLGDELDRGTTTLDRVFAARLDPRTALPGPLDQPGLAMLRQRGVDRMILDDSALTKVDEQFTPAAPYTLRSVPDDDTTSITVLAADSSLGRFLTGNDPPTLRAAHLLAGLALVSREQPSLSRGITLLNPSRWDPSPEFLSAALAGLRANPLLRPVTVDTMLGEVPVATQGAGAAATPVVRSLSSYEAPAPPVAETEYVRALANQQALETLLPAEDAHVLRGRQALLTSVTSLWASPTGRAKARAQLAGIRGSVDGFLGKIHIPTNTTITITSSTADIPLSFRNDTGQPVTVHVKLSSDKLLFPEGAERDLTLPPRNTTARFAVETRSSGTVRVQLVVTTTTGLAIQSSSIEVHSSFVSGVGLFLTIGAVVFLALWWGWDIRRRRMKRGPRATREQRGSVDIAGHPA